MIGSNRFFYNPINILKNLIGYYSIVSLPLLFLLPEPFKAILNSLKYFINVELVTPSILQAFLLLFSQYIFCNSSFVNFIIIKIIILIIMIIIRHNNLLSIII